MSNSFSFFLGNSLILPPQTLYRVTHCNNHTFCQSAWHLTVGAFHWRQHQPWNPVFGETWTPGPDSTANLLCDLERIHHKDSPTCFHCFVSLLCRDYQYCIQGFTYFNLPTPLISPHQPSSGDQILREHSQTCTHRYTDSNIQLYLWVLRRVHSFLIFHFSGICRHLRTSF